MSVTASAFHPLIRPKAPRAPVPTIDTAIRSAAAEFCKRTRCWRAQVTIEVEKEMTAIGPTLPTGAVLHEIERAWFGDCELEPAPFASFDPAELARDDAPPKFITQLTAGKVRLVPRADGTLVLNMIVRPPDTAAALGLVLPDFMRDLHGEAIAAGALARVLATPGDWSDPGMASAWAGVFEARIAEATGTNLKGQQRAPARVRPQFI